MHGCTADAGTGDAVRQGFQDVAGCVQRRPGMSARRSGSAPARSGRFRSAGREHMGALPLHLWRKLAPYGSLVNGGRNISWATQKLSATPPRTGDASPVQILPPAGARSCAPPTNRSMARYGHDGGPHPRHRGCGPPAALRTRFVSDFRFRTACRASYVRISFRTACRTCYVRISFRTACRAPYLRIRLRSTYCMMPPLR